MGELPGFSEGKEKILPNQTLLLAEPIFKAPGMDESKKTKFTIPRGVETWLQQIPFEKLTDQNITEIFTNEYLSITSVLKEINVPFRIIIAHRKLMDERFVAAICRYFSVRGLGLEESISATCFPRDMLVDFDGVTYINPEANFNFSDNPGILSPLGQGGRVLKLGKKVFVPDQRGFVQTRPKYTEDLKTLSDRFEFGFLPFLQAVEIDRQSGTSKIFPNDHLDRVASFIRGADNKDYLLLDNYYVDASQAPYGNHWTCIKEACQKLDVTPVVIDRKPTSIPYALNLEQFADGSVLLTGGDNSLAESVKQIVGVDKVHVTHRPIIYYPLFRNGGIRCMLLHAPQKIVGKPMIPPE